MDTFTKAINGILALQNKEVREKLLDIRLNYCRMKGISPHIPLEEADRKAICDLWADYLIEIGGKK
jgi:hypothetical protein